MRATRLTALAIVLLLAAWTSGGCSRTEMSFVSQGTEYSAGDVDGLHDSVERPASVAGASVAQASALRRDALIALRRSGEEASALAEFVTGSLEDTGRAVPYYGEAAAFEGTDAWVLLELWGSPEGTLDNSRLWVFDRWTGDVLYSSASR